MNSLTRQNYYDYLKNKAVLTILSANTAYSKSYKKINFIISVANVLINPAAYGAADLVE